jgi:hypothetical protein
VAQTDADGNPTPFGVCATGPDSQFCDSMLKANGAGYIGCQTDADCAESTIGVDAGTCSLVVRRSCFLDPIQASGSADPDKPIGAALFCIPPTGNAGINGVAGLPGPGQIINQATSVAYCPDNSQYMAGVGCASEQATWPNVWEILKTNCAACHGGDQNQGGLQGLDWTSAMAYQAVIGGSSQVPGYPLIQPGDSTLSYLMYKLDGNQADWNCWNSSFPCSGGVGVQMPVGGTLPDADRELIRLWINAGSPYP